MSESRVKRCFLCLDPAPQTKRFPPASRPQEQLEWLLRQNRDEDGLLALQNRHQTVKDARWCLRHFNSSSDDLPIDLRPDVHRSLTLPTVSLRTTRPADLVSPSAFSTPNGSQTGIGIDNGTASIPLSPSSLSSSNRKQSTWSPPVSPYNDYGDFCNDDLEERLSKRFKKEVSTKTITTMASQGTDYHYSQETSQGEEDEEIVEDESVADRGRYTIVEDECLLRLFKRCEECGAELDRSLIEIKRCGSARTVRYDCIVPSCNASVRWESQMKVGSGRGRVYSANHAIPIAAFTTGTPLPRLCDFAKLIDLDMPCDRIMRKTIRETGSIAIERVSERWQEAVREIAVCVAGDKGLQVSIDGQYDSPGHTSTNGKVTVIDCETKLALAGVAKSKNDPGIGKLIKKYNGKSCRIESEGALEAILELVDQDIKIRTIVGDQNGSVSKKLREEPKTANIERVFDFWHVQKPMRKEWWKIVKANPELSPIYQSFFNHLYFVHNKYKERNERAYALELVKSFLMHIQGKHKWEKNTDFQLVTECEHGHLRRKKGETRLTLGADSEELEAIRKVLFSTRFKKAFLEAGTLIDTSINESYHSLSLMYASKRFFCSPRYYRLKMLLAMMHHNNLMLDDITGTRSEIGNAVLSRKGRIVIAVKRKRGLATHSWRQEILEESIKLRHEQCTARFMAQLGIPEDDVFDVLNSWWENKEQQWGLEFEEEEELEDGEEYMEEGGAWDGND